METRVTRGNGGYDSPSFPPVRPAADSCHTCTIAVSQREIYVQSLGFQSVFPVFWRPASDPSSALLWCFAFQTCCSVLKGQPLNWYYYCNRISLSFVWLLCVIWGHHYCSVNMSKVHHQKKPRTGLDVHKAICTSISDLSSSDIKTWVNYPPVDVA